MLRIHMSRPSSCHKLGLGVKASSKLSTRHTASTSFQAPDRHFAFRLCRLCERGSVQPSFPNAVRGLHSCWHVTHLQQTWSWCKRDQCRCRKADVMAGGAGAAGHATDLQHEPPGISHSKQRISPHILFSSKNIGDIPGYPKYGVTAAEKIWGYPGISLQISAHFGITRVNPT